MGTGEGCGEGEAFPRRLCGLNGELMISPDIEDVPVDDWTDSKI